MSEKMIPSTLSRENLWKRSQEFYKSKQHKDHIFSEIEKKLLGVSALGYSNTEINVSFLLPKEINTDKAIEFWKKEIIEELKLVNLTAYQIAYSHMPIIHVSWNNKEEENK
jgi:hypothetical protein